MRDRGGQFIGDGRAILFGYGFFGYGLRGPFRFSPIGQKKSPLGFQSGNEEGALGLIDS